MMPPKGVSKAVSKKCPECRIMIPVATRHCHCGHQFFEERRRSITSTTSEQEEPDEKDHNLSAISSIIPTAELQSSSATQNLVPSNGSSLGERKRRSERVKREKPHFYDALEYENQMRKARKERQREELSQNQSAHRIKRERKVKHNSEMDDEDEEDPQKERKKKKKKKKIYNEEEVDEDLYVGVSPNKEKQFSIILSDINLKLGLNNPSFVLSS